MGTCCCADTESSNFQYNETVRIRIKESDMNGNPRPRPYTFHLNYPIHCQFDTAILSNDLYTIQGSIIPGQDPRSQCFKECQDLYFYTSTSDSVLAGLFDGHGSEGARVVSFCVNFMKSFFASHKSFFESSPLEAIQTMIYDCDQAIRGRGSKIDTNLSGTTAVVIYMTQSNVYLGNVGDSRAILGTTSQVQSVLEEEITEVNAYKRQIEVKRKLNSLQLTADHKPNHAEELKRIRGMGGSVQQLTDAQGNRVGPFRVWKKNGNLPGLAMSRSIGDHYSKDLGVSAEATIYEYPLAPLEDMFIIAASDGLWDVMTNSEAVNFVENFRRKSKRQPGLSYPVRPESTTISHLLGEEARYRWFGICEEEEVMIDDISIVIIEMNHRPASVRQRPSIYRSSPVTNSIVNMKMSEIRVQANGRDDVLRKSHAPSVIGSANSLDVVRGSMAMVSNAAEVDLLLEEEER